MLPLCDWHAQGDIYHIEGDRIPRMHYVAPSVKSVGVWFAQIVINHPTKKDFDTEISLIHLDKLQ